MSQERLKYQLCIQILLESTIWRTFYSTQYMKLILEEFKGLDLVEKGRRCNLEDSSVSGLHSIEIQTDLPRSRQLECTVQGDNLIWWAGK